MKWYKTIPDLELFWTNTLSNIYPEKHVEQILTDKGIVNGWTEITNVNGNKLPAECSIIAPMSELPSYIKSVADSTDGTTLYFYLYDKQKYLTTDKEGKQMYIGSYILDRYMTKYHAFIQILKNRNPIVKFNRKYCTPWIKNDDGSYEINFVKKKELSSYLPVNNNQLVRNKIFSTTETELWNLNFSKYSKSTTTIFPEIAGGGYYEIDGDTLKRYLETPNNTGRYRYIVTKASAGVVITNDKKQRPITKQAIFVIPLFKELENNILHGLNDMNLENENSSGCLAALGENFLGYFECDLPFSFLHGMYLDSNGEIKIKSSYQNCNYQGHTDIVRIAFYEIPLNYYKTYKLINYSNHDGFGKRIVDIVNNIEKVTPDTSIEMLAPQYYQEIYNNGNGLIINDISKFYIRWLPEAGLNLYLNCAYGFDKDLSVIYDFGNNTNTQLATYDNTNKIYSGLSIQNSIFGSSAANYFANNTNTILTASQNRDSERFQAYLQQSLNTVKGVADMGFDAAAGVADLMEGDLSSAAKSGKGIFNSIIGTISSWFGVSEQQKRKNKQFNMMINNLYQAPSTNIGSPFLKGIVPNDGLFTHYAMELHPYDKDIVFADLLNNGNVYNNLDNFNNYDNKVYMNILDIDTYYNYDNILKILKQDNKTIFNSQNEYDEFIAWLGNSKKFYKTDRLINVLDWKAPDYVPNIWIEQIPVIKKNINDYIKNISRSEYKAHPTLFIEQLKQDNPEVIDEVWNNIEIVDIKESGCVIKGINDYSGTIVVNSTMYNYEISFDYGWHTFYKFDLNDLCEGTPYFENVLKKQDRISVITNDLITDGNGKINNVILLNPYWLAHLYANDLQIFINTKQETTIIFGKHSIHSYKAFMLFSFNVASNAYCDFSMGGIINNITIDNNSESYEAHINLNNNIELPPIPIIGPEYISFCLNKNSAKKYFKTKTDKLIEWSKENQDVIDRHGYNLISKFVKVNDND